MRNLILYSAILLISTNCERKVENNWDEWPEIHILDGEKKISDKDTLVLGTDFIRQVITLPKSFKDENGIEMILSNQEMTLEIGLDTFPENTYPKYHPINEYLKQDGNLAEIRIPVDSLVKKFHLKESVNWRLTARIVSDTLYVTSGNWVFSKE